MSKIAVSGSASGTGTFTIKSPATNADRVFNLPDEAGTVLTDVSDIEPQVKTATNATGSAPVYACRSWVNFDGTGTPSIRESGNVSSITDIGTGNYRINFNTAMPDANYVCCITGNDPNGNNLTNVGVVDSSVGLQTSYVQIWNINTSNGALDETTIQVMVVR